MAPRPASQLGFFDEGPPSLSSVAMPEGMRYAADIITTAEERDLVGFIETLSLKRFEFAGGFLGNRKVKSFGCRYDYAAQKLIEAEPMPSELLRLREGVAHFAGRPADGFRQALVTEYAPGAGIGWHKDKAMFADVAGVSLLVPCKFRLRRKQADRWERVTIDAAPRSVYLLSGPSRTVWEHSIPPLDQLRYSVTFRNFAG